MCRLTLTLFFAFKIFILDTAKITIEVNIFQKPEFWKFVVH